jgi:hypothetical protein
LGKVGVSVPRSSITFRKVEVSVPRSSITLGKVGGSVPRSSATFRKVGVSAPRSRMDFGKVYACFYDGCLPVRFAARVAGRFFRRNGETFRAA